VKQHETHRLPKGAFCNTSVAPRRHPFLPPRERHRVGEEELPPRRFRIPLMSTPASETTAESDDNRDAPAQ